MPVLVCEHPEQPITTCAFVMRADCWLAPNPTAIHAADDGLGKEYVAVTLNEPPSPLGTTDTLTPLVAGENCCAAHGRDTAPSAAPSASQRQPAMLQLQPPLAFEACSSYLFR
jgi:hypothetical protein